jgi:predicted GIY-YIG superfamily endonuclease
MNHIKNWMQEMIGVDSDVMDSIFEARGSGEWLVYVLRSVARPMRTYAGVTNNLKQRLRQHNGEIAGGARATASTRPWKLYAIICGFSNDKKLAMRCEWFTKVKHYNHGKVPGANGIERRRFLVAYALSKCVNMGRDLESFFTLDTSIKKCIATTLDGTGTNTNVLNCDSQKTNNTGNIMRLVVCI